MPLCKLPERDESLVEAFFIGENIMSPPLVPISEKLKRYIVTPTGCWEWTGGRDKDGYGKLNHRRQTTLRAHRVAYEFYKGDLHKDDLVCHSCDNPPCINPAHLFKGKPIDNTADMIRKNRQANQKGEANGSAIYTETQIAECRKLRKDGLKLKEIQQITGVN